VGGHEIRPNHMKVKGYTVPTRCGMRRFESCRPSQPVRSLPANLRRPSKPLGTECCTRLAAVRQKYDRRHGYSRKGEAAERTCIHTFLWVCRFGRPI
jgi:hypothetical protein